MRAHLLFVPQWSAAHPHHSVTALAGELRRAGHHVRVRDLNLEAYELALSPATASMSVQRAELALEYAKTEVGLRTAVGDHSRATEIAAARAVAVENYMAEHPDPAAGAIDWSHAPGVLRSERFFDPDTLVRSLAAVDRGLELFSLPFAPAEVAWNAFSHPHVPYDLGPMIEFCGDSLANPYYPFLEQVAGELLDGDDDLLAISIGAFSQVLPGLTLARLLKGAGSSKHVSLGGNFFSRLHSRLLALPAFFEVFADSLVIGEGEVPLVHLAAALEREPVDLDRVPSLLYPGDGEVRGTPPAEHQPMNEAAFIDLDGFPLDRYHAPAPVISLRATKGCYWGRCAFCDSHYGLPSDIATPRRFVAELAHLHERWGVRDFELIDQCLPPRTLDSICDQIIAAGLDVRWFCNARTDPGFSPELLAKMRRAGATKVMWGIESGSQRLLDFMDKGVSTAARVPILRAAADAGLWNFAYLFFGFPTETWDEAAETVDLICENTDIIHSYGRSLFTLGRHCPMMERLGDFGVGGVGEAGDDLSVNLTFELARGPSPELVREVSAECTRRARAAYGDPLWMALRTRETLHLYLGEHGRDFVRDYRWEAPVRAPDEFVF